MKLVVDSVLNSHVIRDSFEGMLKFKLGLGAYVVVVDHQIMGAACSVTVIEMLMSTIHA